MHVQAFDTTFHPLGRLMESLVDVFRAAYIGVGAHPRLLHHAVQEVNSYVRRIYQVLRWDMWDGSGFVFGMKQDSGHSLYCSLVCFCEFACWSCTYCGLR